MNKLKSSNPLVTIGIPTYNRPKTLEQTLRSVCGQTYKNLEIIISDNCSPGEMTEMVIKNFMKKDKRITYIRQKENIGLYKNFDFVFNLASGDFFMWMADDDYMDAGMIEACLEFLMNHGDYSLVAGIARYYDRSESFEGEIINLEEDDPSSRVINYYRQVRHNHLSYGLIPREYFPAIKIQHQLADDWIEIARIAFVGKIKVLNDVFYHRAGIGVSTNVEKLFDIFNLDKKRIINYYYFMAINVSKDILCSPFPYNQLSASGRIVLAWKAFKTILAKQNLSVSQALYKRVHNEFSIIKNEILDILKKGRDS